MSLFWSQWYGKFWNKDVINHLVSDWKVGIIRSAMAVNQGGYDENPEKEKAQLITVVDSCIENGIYVVIDWHIEGDNSKYTDIAVKFFTEMSQKYGSNDHVLYEGWNEPTAQSWDTILKPYHEKILAAIRPHTKNLYIAGNAEWSSRADQACANRLDDTNVAYTLHFYAATHGWERRSLYNNVMANGCSVFVTEWGTCQSSGNGTVDLDESKKWLAWTDENGISTANWGLYDKEESCAALKVGSSTTGQWTDDMLTESGKFVRDFLTGKIPLPPVPPRPDFCCAWNGACHEEVDEYCDKNEENCKTCGGKWQKD